MMNRRVFLGAIASAFVADPERLLWTPGAKLISIPKPLTLHEQYIRGNSVMFPAIITLIDLIDPDGGTRRPCKTFPFF